MIIRYPISGDRRFGDLQRIALILVRVTSVHLLTQALYKKTVDAVTPSTGPITMKSAVSKSSEAGDVSPYQLMGVGPVLCRLLRAASLGRWANTTKALEKERSFA
jgi:hypothetical protein